MRERTIFNLAKVNTIPCMFTASLSLFLEQQVDEATLLAYIEKIPDAYSQQRRVVLMMESILKQ